MVNPADIATFLGRKLNGNYQGEMGNRFNYKYYLTDFGREAASMALKLREMVVIPELAFASISPS